MSPVVAMVEPALTPLMIVQLLVIVLAIPVGLIANMYTFYLAFTSRLEVQKQTNIVVVNRTVADFLYLLAISLDVAANFEDSWELGSTLCKLRCAIIISCPLASSMFLVALNTIRYTPVYKPNILLNLHSRSLKVLSIIPWYVVTLISIPIVIHSELLREVFNDRTHCVLQPFSEDTVPNKVFRVFIILMVFVIPLLVSWVFVSLDLLPIKPKTSHHQEDPIGGITDMIWYPKRLQLSLTVVFTICQLPYWVSYLAKELRPDIILNENAMLLFPATMSLPAVNAAINPILYMVLGKIVRHELVNTRARQVRSEHPMIPLLPL